MSQLNGENARARERGREGGKKDSISGGAAETDRQRQSRDAILPQVPLGNAESWY